MGEKDGFDRPPGSLADPSTSDVLKTIKAWAGHKGAEAAHGAPFLHGGFVGEVVQRLEATP